MHACGDVMIGQHGRSVHEAIPHICLFFFLSSPRIKIVNQLNQRLCDLLASLMTLLLVVNLTSFKIQSSVFLSGKISNMKPGFAGALLRSSIQKVSEASVCVDQRGR